MAKAKDTILPEEDEVMIGPAAADDKDDGADEETEEALGDDEESLDETELNPFGDKWEE